jgi:Ni/Co efflux regulator RcnB
MSNLRSTALRIGACAALAVGTLVPVSTAAVAANDLGTQTKTASHKSDWDHRDRDHRDRDKCDRHRHHHDRDHRDKDRHDRDRHDHHDRKW